MRIHDARALARQWVLDEAVHMAGFRGAFSHGSTNWLPGDTPLADTSDLDVMLVMDGLEQPKLGKFKYQGVLLEVSNIARDQLQSAEQILGQYHLAGSFRMATILADPFGELAALQDAVAQGYASRYWVRRRCAHAMDKVLHGFQVRETEPFHDQVNAWLFPAGITTHVLLVAGLKNPTVRQRYVAVRELLTAYGHMELYTPLLELLGCAEMSPAQVERHLDALGEAFDAASAVIKTPFFFAADLSAAGRPIAIDGSRQLIARGDQREAIFWMVATACRCQKVLAHDAPVELQERFRPDFARLLADLGIRSFADLQARNERTRQLLARVWEVAQAILAANPQIEDRPTGE
jgi:hypothetical protein